MATLFFANPFEDRIVKVTDDFLMRHQLKKNETNVTSDIMRVNQIWQEAIKEGGSHAERAGGSGVNVLRPFAKLSKNRTAILGRIGSDDSGAKLCRHFEKLNVTPFLIKSTTLPTGRVLCFHTPDGERTMLTYLGAAGELNAEDIREEQVKDFNHWHFEGYLFASPILEKLMPMALKIGTIRSVNLPTQDFISKFKEAFQKHLKQMDYVFGNLEEIKAVTERNEIQDMFEQFAPNQTVVATDGGNGCWVKANGEVAPTHYPALKVDRVSNKTGAGDIWSGIYMVSALQGLEIKKCVDLANRGAAAWIQQEPEVELTEEMWQDYKI